MTAFSTHFFKKTSIRWVLHYSAALTLLWMAVCAQAQGLTPAVPSTELSQVKVERVADEILLSAQMEFELPGPVEDALLKGIPMYFVAQADLTKERWYWYDKKVVVTHRYMRVAYQPLTRKWRLNVTASADQSGGSTGLALNQSFDTLPQAMAIVKRLFRWRIASTGEVEGGGKYKLELRFRLDLSQLPRPFQIGAIGQSDWDVGASVSMPLVLETIK